jgi:AGCS family alanine or glycine:cation symporter
MRALSLLVALSLFTVAPAFAEEAPPTDKGAEAAEGAEGAEGGDAAATKEETTAERIFGPIDAAFGKWFVGPLASVLFYDLYFWDNTLDGEEAIGTKLDENTTIVGYDELQGYKLEKRFTAPTASATVEATPGSTIPVGPFSVEIRKTDEGLVAMLKPGTVALDGVAAGPLDRWQGPAFKPAPKADDRQLVVVQHLAPFPVVVDTTDGKNEIVPTQVPMPKAGSAVAVGSIVTTEQGRAKVELVEGANLKLLSLDEAWSKDTIANSEQLKIPFIVLWLVLGSIYFTLRMGFINVRAFTHALSVVRGDYDNPEDEGEISHFQALSSALSATVGLGNIAGVAVAVGTGGPGALFWMICAGFLGMSSKFVECTLGQMYRHVDEDGVVSGGPMRYLHTGLGELGLGGLGRVLAILFALMCIGGSFGGGNMFQANQAFAAVSEAVTRLSGADISDYAWLFGLVLAVLVGLVIIGGIKRIGAAASFIVPFMCGMYILAGLYVILTNMGNLGWAFGEIFRQAFTPEAGFGGMLGVLVTGFQRAAFSNEAGVGSAAIAHSAAATEEPIREGIVASIGPFIDTIIVCTMTGLVVVVTKAYQGGGEGIVMTQQAFGQSISWFPLVLSVAVLLFAFSTMISWSYYGERCFTFLFGEGTSLIYRFIYVFFVFFGSVLKLGNVLDFSDLMVLGMAFPNIFGVVLLAPKVKVKLDEYWSRYKNGEMKKVH